MSGLFDLSNMNPSQCQAVTHGEGPLLLLAGPGSGKTYTITNRIFYLLNTGVSPEKILVITFTREAAQSMQKRFASMCGSASYPVNFGTFHSVFYHILRESNVLKADKLLSNSEKIQIVLPILQQYIKEKQEMSTLREDAGILLSCFGYYKNTFDLNAAVKKAPLQFQGIFPMLYEKYQQEIKVLGRVDFDDILSLCKHFLENNVEARKQWQNRFSHILLDEFQDINPVQYEIIKLLSAEPYNIFAVGDDDQAIYGFRGANPECMQQYVRDFKARQLCLDTNYRSSPEIVAASLMVIEENKYRFQKALKAASDNVKEPIKIEGFQDKINQYNYLLQEIVKKVKKGESCAVLFRTNQYMQSFAARLKRAEIPFIMREQSMNIYEHFIVKDIIAYLLLAKGKGNREQLLGIIQKSIGYFRREAVIVKNGKPDFENMKEFYERVEIGENEKRKILQKLSLFERQMKILAEMSLSPGVNYILKVMGYEQYLKERSHGNSDKIAEWMEIIEHVKDDCQNFKTLEAWNDFINDYGKDVGKKTKNKCNGKAINDGANISEGVVQLLTVHSAKGLEFDNVWIPDCNERVFPHGRMPDEDTVEEERRIFYVAMTRAKKCLELLYIKGTKERPRQRSEFLNPLYSSINSSNSQLSKYSSNASATFSYSSSLSI